MKKTLYFSTFGLALILGFFFFQPAHASSDTSKCIVTIKKFLLKNRSGEWITVPGIKGEADLLAEEPLIFFVNHERVPSGKYVNFKIVLSETLKLSGSDRRHKTLEGGEITVNGTASSMSDLPGEVTSIKVIKPNINEQLEGIMTQHLNFDFEDRDDEMEIYSKRNYLKPFKIEEHTSIHVWVTISPEGTMHYGFKNSIKRGIPAESLMYFIPPGKIKDLSITVKSSSLFVPEDAIVWDF